MIRKRGRQRIGRLVLLLFLTAISVLLSIWRESREEGRLVDARDRRVLVTDGDTLRIADETIRLFGIDAPERDQFCHDRQGGAWSCGMSARLSLQRLVALGGLRCSIRGQDKYRRSVATCAVTGVDDIGERLVREGWALDLPDKSGHRYQQAEQYARDHAAGIWIGSFEKPWLWRQRAGANKR